MVNLDLGHCTGDISPLQNCRLYSSTWIQNDLETFKDKADVPWFGWLGTPWRIAGVTESLQVCNRERMTSFHGLRMGLGLAVITSVSCQGPLRKFTVDHSSPLAMLSPWPLVPKFCFPVLVWCLETLRLDETSLRPSLGLNYSFGCWHWAVPFTVLN